MAGASEVGERGAVTRARSGPRPADGRLAGASARCPRAGPAGVRRTGRSHPWLISSSTSAGLRPPRSLRPRPPPPVHPPPPPPHHHPPPPPAPPPGQLPP